MLPQKHKEAGVCVYKSGFFMITNKMPYFGEGPDAEAISTCLAVFDTQPLPQVRRSCTRWMRKNCMTVFHYCADKLKNEPLFSDNADDSDSDGNNSDEGSEYNITKQMTTCSTFMKYLDSTFHRKASSVKLQVPLKRLVLVWFQTRCWTPHFFCMTSLTQSCGRETINT